MTHQWREQNAGPGFTGEAAGDLWGVVGPQGASVLDRTRKWLLLCGALALIAGAAAIAVPIVASVTVALFIGWLLVFSGVVMAVHATSERALLRGVEALVTLIVGFYLLVFPLTGTVTLTFVLAVWLFAGGVLSLAYAWQLGAASHAWAPAVSGVCSIVLGILIAAGLPSSGAWAIGLIVGINLLFWGARALVAAHFMKRLTHA